MTNREPLVKGAGRAAAGAPIWNQRGRDVSIRTVGNEPAVVLDFTGADHYAESS